jgi:hypothetical protein
MSSRPPIFRSSTYFIAHRSVMCVHCKKSTRVAAVVLPVDHEVLADDEEGAWQTIPAPALIFGVGELPKTAEAHLRRLAPAFGWVAEETPDDASWSNSCEHCGARIDDEALHCEPGESFVPMSEVEGARIRLVEIAEPFEVWARGYSLDALYLPFKRPS